MPAPLDQINTIVLLMMENRSFDHMLGHLTIDDPTLKIEGLKTADTPKYANPHKGTDYVPYPMPDDQTLPCDLPHEANFVAQQMAKDPKTKDTYTMQGFVDAYAAANPTIPITPPRALPMAYFPASLTPITTFLAKNFCICDHWFSPIPTSTQPNRTMAFCGYTPIYQTRTQVIQIEQNIFDWMDNNKVSWRVYHDGFPFFSLYDKLWLKILGDGFKRYEEFHAWWTATPDPGKDPKVVIIEPCYEDAPHFGGKHPNDNHAPLSIGWGEEFLRQTYLTLTANRQRWANTLFVVYYDEHGGFFDHVPPMPIPSKTTGEQNQTYSFESTGPRIPGLLISPFVAPGSVCSQVFDHTSVLQFLAEKFTPGKSWSDAVDQRRQAGIRSISTALDNTQRPNPPTPPSQLLRVTADLGKFVPPNQGSEARQSFSAAATSMMAAHPETKDKFPELLSWQDYAAALSTAQSPSGGSPAPKPPTP